MLYLLFGHNNFNESLNGMAKKIEIIVPLLKILPLAQE